MLIVLLLRLGSTDKWLDLESLIHIEYSRMSRVWKVNFLTSIAYGNVSLQFVCDLLRWISTGNDRTLRSPVVVQTEQQLAIF